MKLIKNIYTAIEKMINHDGIEHSGYMSFMMLVSIFPFCIFMLALTSFLGNSELGEKFIAMGLESMPEESISGIKSRIDELLSAPGEEFLTIAIFGTLWTSSSFVECIRTILNRVYYIESPPSYIPRRLLSVLQFLLISLAIALAMLILIFIPIGISKVPSFKALIEEYTQIINISRYILIFFSLFMSICAIYYLIPNMKMRLLEVMPGACLTVLGWITSGYLLTNFIKYYNQLSVVYGSLAGMIVTLIFFYIVNMIFIVGAEFNYVLSRNKEFGND